MNAHKVPHPDGSGKSTCVCDESFFRNEDDPYCCDPCPHNCKTCHLEKVPNSLP